MDQQLRAPFAVLVENVHSVDNLPAQLPLINAKEGLSTSKSFQTTFKLSRQNQRLSNSIETRNIISFKIHPMETSLLVTPLHALFVVASFGFTFGLNEINHFISPP